jgi:hypothetical protein
MKIGHSRAGPPDRHTATGKGRLGKLLEVEQRIVRSSDGTEHLIELEVHSSAGAVLRVLNGQLTRRRADGR